MIDSINFFTSLVILTTFGIPVCYLSEIMGDFVGKKIWQKSKEKSRGYISNEIPGR